MPPIPTTNHTILDHLTRVAAGRWSARQAVEEALSRCDTLEGELHAWVHLDRAGALEQADRLDAAKSRGEAIGPLFGVPVAVKDLFDLSGWPTGCGSRLLESGPPAARSAPLVARLQAAGAVVLGKTVTTQFACFDPPRTRNPWNVDRTPGGSSSGSAVAVATGMCLAALGSQTGGSITRPASFCGIAGLKPSFDRLPIEGVYPVASSLDHPGPMARTVADLQLLNRVLSLSSQTPEWDPLQTQSKPPRTIGVLRGMFQEKAEGDCWDVFERTLAKLRGAGADVRECRLPTQFDTVIATHRAVMITEIASHHESRLAAHPDDYLPGMRSLIEEGIRARGVDYVRAKSHQAALKAALRDCFDEFDLLACPATRGGAPTRETTGDPSFNAPWSYTGLPTVTLPMGVDSAGMPLGLQLVGKRDGDADLLSMGVWCENSC